MKERYSVFGKNIQTEFKKKFLLLLSVLFIVAYTVDAQRPMEYLDRALVVQERSGGGTYLTWRMLGTDPRNVAFNLYNGTNNKR